MSEQAFSHLNDAQRQAVLAEPGQHLILAGAGSGKTRVLVERIARLLGEQQYTSHQVLAVTFTNKAANEMRTRIEEILGYSAAGMWIGTFHSLAHRMLRLHYAEANLPNGFQILDGDDQLRIVRRLIKELDLDDKRFPPKLVQWFINQQKDEGLRSHQVPKSQDFRQATLLSVYQRYEEVCEQAGFVDFAEILLRALLLLQENISIQQHYQERFKYVLVDEFQDTNAIQYAWIKTLAGEQGNIFVVGDDDQSIYAWRGAKIENIQRFQHDFSQVQVIRLEQNYRSTGTILEASNQLISCNQGRLGKSLWTAGNEGERIGMYAAFNEIDEARFVVSRIQQYVQNGYSRQEIAILYRSNAQSRIFEEVLINAGIPYRIYGGVRYFERAEIKDALAYLRLVQNPHDDASFDRVINLPTRGIGERTLVQIRLTAREQHTSLWEAAHYLLKQEQFSARAATAVSGFCELISDMYDNAPNLELEDLVLYVIGTSGLLDHYRAERGAAAISKVENLEELMNAAREFIPDLDVFSSKLGAFLAQAALEAGEKTNGMDTDEVQLMTLHAAKGLEFAIVFMCGMEEAIFPHFRSLEDPKGLEEERRLCYVGMTRTKEKLFMSYAESRRLHGSQKHHRPSRFLRELPREYIEDLSHRAKVSRPSMLPSQRSTQFSEHSSCDNFTLGQRVQHKTFGEGIILSFEGKGPQTRVQVQFDSDGSKWLVLAYAKLAAV